MQLNLTVYGTGVAQRGRFYGISTATSGASRVERALSQKSLRIGINSAVSAGAQFFAVNAPFK